MPKGLNDIIRWGFGLFLMGASSMLINSINKISDSIDSLNVKVAVIIEKVTNHDRELERHEDRIFRIEKKCARAQSNSKEN